MDLSTPALLFPAIAILTLGYVNRYLGIANVIRAFAKDYNDGHKRAALSQQLQILKRRAELTRYMLTLSATALIVACISMLFVFLRHTGLGEMFFALSLTGMILSLFVSLYETRLSNRSLIIEVDDILKQEATS